MLYPSADGTRYYLTSPTLMPRAAGFLWNRMMMIQMNCRGYAVSQFMQPEPAQYAHAPNLEATGSMQPEQPYYAHHPARFFYIRDDDTGEIFSAPYEPVKRKPDEFSFSQGKGDISWELSLGGIGIEITLRLPPDDVVELWSLRLANHSETERSLSVFPYFTPGYMSWMNQAAEYREDLGGVVASSITAYRVFSDYEKNRNLKDKTYLLHDRVPVAWQTQREAFEGDGGLHNPDALQRETLACDSACYETPLAALQYRVSLGADAWEMYRFAFGPARDDAEIASIRDRYLSAEGFAVAEREYAEYVGQGRGALHIETPDKALDNFVNEWLPRQIFYHGDVNRLSTDPQTRNYLQDNMGMVYISADRTRSRFLHALSQQEADGSMPDGILLHEDAELKYINQVPHTDHCVWLPVCLRAYLDETGDTSILAELVVDDHGTERSVFDRITRAMDWLLGARDRRGLSYIAQGDWCDPMNMVGHRGRGVSGWLSVATAYALKLWAAMCRDSGRPDLEERFAHAAYELNAAVNRHLWDGAWYGRGITDDDVVFGISADNEGRIFLNPQTWAILAGTCSEEQRRSMILAVEEQLETPYGVATLAPAYTAMREDVGRVTQKFPGTAENGSVYNHAAIFYIYSLYTIGESDRAFRLLRQLIPGPDPADLEQRGQMPIFIPNYYRGAFHQHPRTAGRSSQLFNTGTVGWLYRSLVDGLFGLRGDGDGLIVSPQFPADWDEARVVREFRGATLHVAYARRADVKGIRVEIDGVPIEGCRLGGMVAGETYQVSVVIGAA